MRTEQALQVAVRAARAGGRVLAETDRHGLEVTLKDERVDLTTSADKASHEAVVAVLHESCPDHSVVGEDGTASGADTEHVWYVDALDGTSNFANGLPWYCVSVALRSGPDTVAGAVYDPVHDELFSAGAGLGATCNGIPLHVSATERLERALVVTQSQTSDPAVIREFVTLLEALLNHTAGVRYPGAPALILSHIAAGHFTAYCERYMDPWDIVAGALILEEAGGRLTGFDGNPVEWPGLADVVASNGPIHDALLAVLPESPQRSEERP